MDRLVASYNRIGKNLFNCRTCELPYFNWPSFNFLLAKANIRFAHGIIQDCHAPQLLGKLLPKSNVRTTRSKDIFEHPQIHKNIGKKAFANWIPRLWDHMDENLRTIEDRRSFATAVNKLFADFDHDHLATMACGWNCYLTD